MGKIHERFKAKNLLQLPTDGKGLTLAQALRGNGVYAPRTSERGAKLHDMMEEDPNQFKGRFQGLCNRSACLSPDEVEWYNKYTYAFYCKECADDINGFTKREGSLEVFIHKKTAEEAAQLYVQPQPI